MLEALGNKCSCSPDSVEEVADRKMPARLASIRSNSAHPLHHTVGGPRQHLTNHAISAMSLCVQEMVLREDKGVHL